MVEYVTQNGWYQFHKCTCGGTLSLSFKNPNKGGMKLKIKPNRNTWQMSGTRKASGVGLDTLKTYLDEL